MSSTQQMKELRNIMEGQRTYHQEMLEIFEDRHARETYLEWHSMGTMLTEAKVTQDQIQQIFAAVAAGASQGKNVDAPGTETPAGTVPKRGILGSISGAWSNFKDKIAQSKPVNGFDVKFDQAQKKILSKMGGKEGMVGKALQTYKQFATKYPKMQGAIWAAVAILAGMSGWGLAGPAIAGGIRTIDRLLQGDRFSSALWKGFKAGALSYGAGQVADFIKTPSAPVDTSGYPTWADPYHSGDLMPQGTQYTVQSGDNLSTLAKKFGVSVKELMAANPDMYNPSNPNDLAAGAKLNIPSATGSAVYQGGVGTAADTAAKVASGQYTPSRYGIKESILDIDRMNRTWQLQESMKLPQRSKPYITAYGIAKVFESVAEAYVAEETYDDYVKRTGEAKRLQQKFDLMWRKNWDEYSQADSVDVNTVVDFLRRMGMKDGLINSTFSSLKIPMVDVTPDTAPVGPAPTEPAPTEPKSTEPASAEPAPTEPAPTEPKSTEPASTEPKSTGPTGPTSGQEIELHGTKFKYTPQWLTPDGAPAGPVAEKVLNQLASGVARSDLDYGDFMMARRNLYKGAPGMTESKKLKVKKK